MSITASPVHSTTGSVGSAEAAEKIWYTRCPVPTASGLAYNLGWLGDAFGAAGVEVGILQDAPLEIARHHYDHRLVGLIREGGNVPAIAARAEGAPTVLIGLTWIDEGQAIVVRADSAIDNSAGLRGARIAVPGWSAARVSSMSRAMALHGAKNALALDGLSLDDVEVVEIPIEPVLPPGRIRDERGLPRWPELDAVSEGRADATYVKGAAAQEAARERGLVIAVDLDAQPDRESRVNNGTPRPITVHRDLLGTRPELVEEFLVQTLRAAEWAAGNLDGVRDVLAGETGSGADGVLLAYRHGFHRTLHPTLEPQRIELLRRQKNFLQRHGFLDGDVDVESWVDAEPLTRARARIAAEQAGSAAAVSPVSEGLTS